MMSSATRNAPHSRPDQDRAIRPDMPGVLTARVPVPPGAQSGSVLRVKGGGPGGRWPTRSGWDPATIWRWDQVLAADGVAGLVPARRGPKGASKLTPELVERIAGLDAARAALREIAAATGVSTFSVRNALGRVPSGGQGTAARVAARTGSPGTL